MNSLNKQFSSNNPGIFDHLSDYDGGASSRNAQRLPRVNTRDLFIQHIHRKILMLVSNMTQTRHF